MRKHLIEYSRSVKLTARAQNVHFIVMNLIFQLARQLTRLSFETLHSLCDAAHKVFKVYIRMQMSIVQYW